MEYDQMNLNFCKRLEIVSLKKVTSMVPANEPPMIKSGVEIENDKDREYYDVCIPLSEF